MIDRLKITNATNPLYVDEVSIPSSGGKIGMTICPGNKSYGISGTHDRDLLTDLEAIRQWGAEILVSLIEEHEYREIGVANLGDVVPEGVLHIKLPIEDMGIPDAAWERRWEREGKIIRSVLRRGGKVCIHCIGGLGRTGLVAARILVEFGVHPERAISSVRESRPGTIQTQEQEDYIRALEPIWRDFDRATACMLAGACGDALGATVEFMDRGIILSRFGAEGIRDFVDNEYGSAGKITDDTQMSLFTAEGLIRAEVRGRLRGLLSYEGCMYHAYLRWLDTQGEKVLVDHYRPDGWLIGHRELFS
jgi:ADP-ribosyl-[dinitrogen reductase] hydrolase